VLNTVNNTGIIEHADDLVKRVKQILDSIEDEKIAALFSDIAALVHRAVEMDLVGKLSQTLDTVHSMSGLIKFATELGHYGGILMIPWAAPLSKTIKSFINYYLYEEEKSNLQRLLETAREQLYMSIIQVGATSDTNRLVGFIVKCKPIYDMLSDDDKDEYNKILKRAKIYQKIHEPNLDTINHLKIATTQCEKLIQTLYCAEFDPNNTSETMNNICLSAISSPAWESIIGAAVYQKKQVINNTIFSRDELSYALVKRLYGDKNISEIMIALSCKFSENGFNDLYYALSDSAESAPEKFCEIIRNIPHTDQTIKENFLLPEPVRLYTDKIYDFYHNWHIGAGLFIVYKWEKMRKLNLNLPHLPAEVLNVIALRAFLECSKETSKFFFTPYNVPREIKNGVFDFFYGIGNIFIHPFNTVINTVTFPYDMATDRNGRRSKLGSAIYNHPTRMSTSLIFSGAAGVASIAGAHAFGAHATFLHGHATSATAASSASMTYNLSSLDNNKADIQHLKKPRHDEEKCDLLEMPTYKDLLKDQGKVQEFAKAYGIVLSDGKNPQLPVPIGGSLVTGISGLFSASSSLQFQNNQPSCDEEKVAYKNFGNFSL